MEQPSFLISGTGIAGPALAFWFPRENFSTTPHNKQLPC